MPWRLRERDFSSTFLLGTVETEYERYSALRRGVPVDPPMCPGPRLLRRFFVSVRHLTVALACVLLLAASIPQTAAAQDDEPTPIIYETY